MASGATSWCPEEEIRKRLETRLDSGRIYFLIYNFISDQFMAFLKVMLILNKESLVHTVFTMILLCFWEGKKKKTFPGNKG